MRLAPLRFGVAHATYRTGRRRLDRSGPGTFVSSD